jgi:hypothetical protein
MFTGDSEEVTGFMGLTSRDMLASSTPQKVNAGF